MNIGQVIQKILDLIAAARAGDYAGAMLIAWGVIKAIIDSMPPASVGVPRPLRAGVDLSSMSESELLDELESQCKASSTMMGATAMASSPTGPVVDVLLPILLALLKKWLGV